MNSATSSAADLVTTNTFQQSADAGAFSITPASRWASCKSHNQNIQAARYVGNGARRDRTVVAITEAGSVVLVRQYRHAAGEVFLELPGGAADPEDASLEHAAQRELREETGFTAERWQHVISLHSNPATHTNRVHFFLALDATYNGPPRLDAGEDGLRVEFLDIPSVLGGLRSGLLGHAMHVSGVLLGLAAAGRLILTAA